MNRVCGRIDLLQMDIQGLEAEVLAGACHVLRLGKINALLIGTHSREIHFRCEEAISSAGYAIEYSDPAPDDQPDGILIGILVGQRAGDEGQGIELATCAH
jgi:hypothetical protein